VREKDGVDSLGIDWEGCPVAQTQLFVALKQSAIDQNTVAIEIDQVF